MSEHDEAERKAGEVLPCNSPYELRKCWDANNHIRDICPAYYRPAVTALLCERDVEIGELTTALSIRNDEVTGLQGMLAEAKAELSSLRSRLGEAEKSAQDQIDLYAAGEAQAKREAVELKRRLEAVEKERDTLKAVQAAFINADSRSGHEWNLAERIVSLEAEAQADRVEALRDLDIEIDTLPFATDADSALSFKYRVKSRIAAMIDAEEKKARDV